MGGVPGEPDGGEVAPAELGLHDVGAVLEGVTDADGVVPTAAVVLAAVPGRATRARETVATTWASRGGVEPGAASACRDTGALPRRHRAPRCPRRRRPRQQGLLQGRLPPVGRHWPPAAQRTRPARRILPPIPSRRPPRRLRGRPARPPLLLQHASRLARLHGRSPVPHSARDVGAPIPPVPRRPDLPLRRPARVAALDGRREPAQRANLNTNGK